MKKNQSTVQISTISTRHKRNLRDDGSHCFQLQCQTTPNSSGDEDLKQRIAKKREIRNRIAGITQVVEQSYGELMHKLT